jgi:hypothetical protein
MQSVRMSRRSRFGIRASVCVLLFGCSVNTGGTTARPRHMDLPSGGGADISASGAAGGGAADTSLGGKAAVGGSGAQGQAGGAKNSPCTDSLPPGTVTCANVITLGWCGQSWLNGACAESCGLCGVGGASSGAQGLGGAAGSDANGNTAGAGGTHPAGTGGTTSDGEIAGTPSTAGADNGGAPSGGFSGGAGEGNAGSAACVSTTTCPTYLSCLASGECPLCDGDCKVCPHGQPSCYGNPIPVCGAPLKDNCGGALKCPGTCACNAVPASYNTGFTCSGSTQFKCFQQGYDGQLSEAEMGVSGCDWKGWDTIHVGPTYGGGIWCCPTSH